MTSLLTVLFATAVNAAPVGDPIAHPGMGRVRLGGSYGMGSTDERDSLCTGEGCNARTESRVLGVDLGVSLLRGVGLYGFANWADETIAEARFKTRVRTLGGGVRLAFPINRTLWIAADTKVGTGEGKNSKGENLSDPGMVESGQGSSTLMTVFGHPEDGGHAWLGLQYPWWFRHEVHPLGQEGVPLRLPLEPRFPVSAVIGATLISDRIGTPWGNSPRLSGSIEVRVGQENAMTISTGLAF